MTLPAAVLLLSAFGADASIAPMQDPLASDAIPVPQRATPAPAKPATSSPVPIHDIQGPAHISAYADSFVTTSGIVTVVDTNGFYLQDPIDDQNEATSEGIFVYTSTAPTVLVGDMIQLAATVREYRPGSNGLTISQLADPQVSVLSHANPLPPPVVIGVNGRRPPSAVINDDSLITINIESDSSADFDPAGDGIDFFESLEGMRVRIDNPTVIGPTRIFGGGGSGQEEMYVVGDGGALATPRTERNGLHVLPADFNPERIVINNRLQPVPRVDVGDSIAGSIVGVMSYNFGKFLFLPTEPLPATNDAALAREQTALAGDSCALTVATFNVFNLDGNDNDGSTDVAGGQFGRLAMQIAVDLAAPDIIGLQEVQDDSGTVNDGTVSADQTFALLIQEIAAAGGPLYDFRQIDPVDNQDGSQTGGNIRVGVLYNPARVTFLDRGNAGPLDATEVISGPDGPQLTLSPGRIAPTNPAWAYVRKPLAAELDFYGKKLFIVVNHFSAKTGDDPLFGFHQPPIRASEPKRVEMARVVNGFVRDLLAEDAGANVLILGDFNDFDFSAPLVELSGAELVNPSGRVDPGDRYTYIFEGNSGALDHVLLTGGLAQRVEAGVDIVHLNAEYADQASDHDPVVVRLDFCPECAGDTNNDNQVTPADLRRFVDCAVGPDTPMALECQDVSMDDDGDGDLADFATIQNEFSRRCTPAQVPLAACPPVGCGIRPKATSPQPKQSCAANNAPHSAFSIPHSLAILNSPFVIPTLP